MSGFLCYFSISCTTTTLANASLKDLFSALTGWIVGAVQWLLSTVVSVLTATSDPSTIIQGANQEFETLLSIAPVLMVLGLLVATLQALRHGDHASLWRTYLGVAPACVAAIYLARPLALDILQATDALSVTASGTTAIHLTDLATALNGVGVIPSFGVFLLAGLVVLAAVLLWVELLFRTVALTFLLVLVPIVVPLSVFPSLRRAGWRLAETFLVLTGAKIIVVIALALGLSETVGTTPTAVLSGVVTLLMACATPFLLFRLVPMMEQSAVHALDGVRRRATQAAMNAPSSPLGLAYGALRPATPPPTPEVGDDLGFPTWSGSGDLPLPPHDGERPDPPTGQPRVRRGRKTFYTTKYGPTLGWHWDD